MSITSGTAFNSKTKKADAFWHLWGKKAYTTVRLSSSLVHNRYVEEDVGVREFDSLRLNYSFDLKSKVTRKPTRSFFFKTAKNLLGYNNQSLQKLLEDLEGSDKCNGKNFSMSLRGVTPLN